jgi:hypothetical protein
VALVLLVTGNGCSPSPAPKPDAQPTTVCFGRVPGEWAAAWKDKTIHLPRGVTFGVGAVDGDLAFGQIDNAGQAGVGHVDLGTGRLSTIAPYAAGVSGLGWLSVDRPWVVWEQLDSVTDLSDWSVHAYNLNSGNGFVLATGTHVPGRQPMPVVRHGVAAWSQAVSGQGGEIVAVDLATRQTRTLATGRVGSPVYAGDLLVWSEVDSEGSYSFAAVDAQTLRPARLPAGLGSSGNIGFLGGSPGYLLWASQDSSVLHAVRLSDGTVTTLTLPDRRHLFQFLQVAGDFVVWYGGITSSVLDLTTGKGFDIAGTVTGSAGWIAASMPQTAPGGITTSVVRIPTSAASHITRCA